MNTMHIGGCIVNRSPDEIHGRDCDCYKIEFMACAFGEVYHVRMCREWVRYMAERERWHTANHAGRTGNVVKRYVREALGVGDDWMRWHHVGRKPRGKVGIEVAGDYGALPTHFVEVVMDNRYGRLSQMIPCHIAADIRTSWHAGDTDRCWTGWVKGYRDIMAVNHNTHRRFMRALERACGRSEACKLTGIDDRKLLVAMTELLKLKINEHETHEQQVCVALPV